MARAPGDQSLARGAAGSRGGAHQDLPQDNVENARAAEPKGALEERRETQSVPRPTTDGIDEGLTKDAS